MSRAAYMREYRARKAAERDKSGLLPFQSAFVAAVCRENRPPAIAAASWPRGSGKSWLCGNLVARSLTPGDPLHEPGVENVLVASSRPQASIVLDFARESLGESSAHRWRKDGAIHIESRARVRVISSDAKRALGLGANVRLIVADEPGSWPVTAGLRLWNAICTSTGKRKTTVIAIGTLAPAPLTGPGSFWPDLIKQGSGEGRHVALLQADPAKWRDFDEVLRVNPVAAINPYLRQTLEREHKVALKSERAARTFRNFRLNLPGDPIESQPLITVAEFERCCARPVPPAEGRPIVGIDLGGNRSWSAAAAIFPTGRIESWALAPGDTSLASQEHEDHVVDGAYGDLVKSGGLSVDAGRAVPSVELLLSRIWAWKPAALVSDSYRSPELHQVVSGRVRVIEKARGGGESTSNVMALRSLLLDSNAGVVAESRALLAAAFAQTNLVISNDGLTKVVKLDQRRSRDDAAQSLLLAAGERARRPAPVALRAAVVSKSGAVTWL